MSRPRNITGENHTRPNSWVNKIWYVSLKSFKKTLKKLLFSSLTRFELMFEAWYTNVGENVTTPYIAFDK